MKKLNKNLDALWQKPWKKVLKSDPEWYERVPIGRDPLNDAMKNLSTKANLSHIYTNHCIRASVVTSLDEHGIEARHIMATTGHKSENSIKSYAAKCPDNKRREVSDVLASNLIGAEPPNKIAKISALSPSRTVAINPDNDRNAQEAPHQESLEIEYPDQNDNQQNVPLIPTWDDIPDDFLINTLTQIEKENLQVNQQETNVTVTKESATKTVNYSSNQNKLPNLPPMYFPNSNVTINYHFHK